MVGIAAYLVLRIHEPLVYGLSRHEFGDEASVLGKNGLYPVELGGLVAVDKDLVPVFQPVSYIFREKFEILVERRLGGYSELYFVVGADREGSVNEHRAELLGERKEITLPVHVGRIQPQHGRFRQQVEYAGLGAFSRRHDVGDDLHLLFFRHRKLSVAVEDVDFLHLVAPEGDSVGVIPGI